MVLLLVILQRGSQFSGLVPGAGPKSRIFVADCEGFPHVLNSTCLT